MKTRGTHKHSRKAALILTLALAASITAQPPNVWASSHSPQSASASERIKRLEAQLEQCGKDLDRALVELEHTQNLNTTKDEKIKALEEKAQAAVDLANLYKATADQLRIADSERAKANAIDDERVRLYEKRILLYEESLKAFEAEVIKLRKQRGLRFKIGAGIAVVCLGLGAVFTLAVRQ